MNLNHRASSPQQKVSTIELKNALQKIKQTQLQVLKALRNEATDNQNQNEHNHRENQELVSYPKSITHLNILKMAQISHMRKQFEKQKQRWQQKLHHYQGRINQLQSQIEAKMRVEVQLRQQKESLNSKMIELATTRSTSNVNSSSMRTQVHTFQQELTDKIKQKLQLQNKLHHIENKCRDLTEECEVYKKKYQQIVRDGIQKDKGKNEKNMKMSQHFDHNRLPIDEMIAEVKKISQYHQKLYVSLKQRTRVTVSDLDSKQEYQKSISKLQQLIENYQKYLNEQKRIIEIDDSVIHGGKIYDSQSFRDEVKKIDKQMSQMQTLRKEVYELKSQILLLKQSKQSCQFQLAKIKQYADRLERRCKQNNLEAYQQLAEELHAEMEAIRAEKIKLTNLVRKISLNQPKNGDEQYSKSMRQELSKILQINDQLRAQNQQYKIINDGHLITIESFKHSLKQIEDKKIEMSIIIDNHIKQREVYIQKKLKMDQQLNQRQKYISNLQFKLQESTKTISINSKKYEYELQSKVREVIMIRQQMQRQMKQLKQLRQIAYNYQLISAENEQLRKKLLQVNSSFIHLWQVKQAEYENASSILQHLRSL